MDAGHLQGTSESCFSIHQKGLLLNYSNETLHVQVVSELKAATRGYLWRKGGFMNTWARKFFIVHEDSITCHEDHTKTAKIESAVKLFEGMIVVEERPDDVFAVVRDGADLLLLRANEEGERDMWMTAIKKAAVRKDAAVASGGGDGADDDTKYILQSTLEVRADKQRAANW